MPGSSMLSLALLIAALLSPVAIVAGPPRFSGKIAPKTSHGSILLNKSKSSQEKPNKVADVTAHLQKTVNRIINGLKSIPKNFLEAERLKKIRKAGGNAALTFSEYGFIEKTNEDLSKIFRMVVTIPFSPEFFFYSYIVFPAMASNNPFAWSSMSSGFDADPNDAKKRIETLEKRRIQTLVSGLVAMKGETIEVGQENKIKKREAEIVLIEKALKTSSSSIKNAIKEVESFFMCVNEPKEKSLKIKLKDVPGSIVKGCCRSIGVEGLPNIPVINKLNIGEVSKYFDKIRDSDEFLQTIGVKSLQSEELKKACHDRCIRVTGSSDSALKGQLQEWLDIACEQRPYSRGDKFVLNEQNRRLALMGFHVARDIKKADFSTIYKVLA